MAFSSLGHCGEFYTPSEVVRLLFDPPASLREALREVQAKMLLHIFRAESGAFNFRFEVGHFSAVH
jgi:hypothetical protein